MQHDCPLVVDVPERAGAYLRCTPGPAPGPLNRGAEPPPLQRAARHRGALVLRLFEHAVSRYRAVRWVVIMVIATILFTIVGLVAWFLRSELSLFL
jgi:hypothetical protein